MEEELSAMYAYEQFFGPEPRRPVVPNWFKGLVVPLLLLLALPISLLVLSLVLAIAAARGVLRKVMPAPVQQRRQRQSAGPQPKGQPEILTDVDYVVLDDTTRR
ncbi:hypothetical protein N825_03385 [Skermanella stibiiresistens SB22]|uniref:Uncharacterized protein n=1 Tax=Skermanella stibiiresistens SB22 TaxID=1385369 RepID=W9H8M8_9PROT|nr:hypothetical protein [Skermanella stibiiresistens]EWY40133.1 hypothetical protein N825_03385 [Skermanella stibiiresistens SB22]